jgi:hypothetical protein
MQCAVLQGSLRLLVESIRLRLLVDTAPRWANDAASLTVHEWIAQWRAQCHATSLTRDRCVIAQQDRLGGNEHPFVQDALAFVLGMYIVDRRVARGRARVVCCAVNATAVVDVIIAVWLVATVIVALMAMKTLRRCV